MSDSTNNQSPDRKRISRQIRALTDPLIKMRQDTTSAVGGVLVVSVQRVLAEAGPRQADVLRRCAIPHWFDLDVLAMLRERADGNTNIMEQLRSYSFVRQLDEHRFTYHDEVRQLLLHEWRETRPDELRTLNQRLADYFRERALASAPSRSLPKNLPFMTLSAAPVGEWELCEREAIYHRLQADQAQGLRELRQEFDRVEFAHRLADAEALVQLTRDVPLDPPGQQLVRYLRARIERAALRLNSAARVLNDLRTDGVTDLQLSAEVDQTLGEVLAETGRWVRAIELYRGSLAYYRQAGMHYEAAMVMLRIGEAYQEIALNTGGWHVPALPRSRFWRGLAGLWWRLLALPFALLAALVGPARWRLPQPLVMSSYQNWLLIWTYRRAQGWYTQAHAAFEAQGEEAGILLTEQRLAQILLLFGYPDEALARLDALLKHPAAEDPYARAWIQRDRASALMHQGKLSQAQALLKHSLATFREVGDIRREAAVLTLISQNDALQGHAEVALRGYRESLAHYRALHFTAAREQALYDLRAWRRLVGPGPLASQIGAILHAEPIKRYVARCPRSQMPLLQALSLSAVPLALLAVAVALLVSPSLRIQVVGPLVLPSVYYDPLRAIAVLLIMLLLYATAYTLMGLAVIFLVPFGALEREQPDTIITAPEGITRYGERGEREQRVEWGALLRYVRLDRRLWYLPLPLFSSTHLQPPVGERLLIDGITGWYLDLQEDIEQRLRDSGNPLRCEDLGFTILRSKSGVSFVLGLLLLTLLILASNTWNATSALLLQLSPALYGALAFAVFSGALVLIPMAYWLVTRPLALYRVIRTNDWWPYVTALLGLAALLMGLGSWMGVLAHLPTLDIGLFFWGTYVLTDSLVTLLRPRRLVRIGVIVAVLLLAAALMAQRINTSFLGLVNIFATAQAAALSAPSTADSPGPTPTDGSAPPGTDTPASNPTARSNAQIVLDNAQQVAAQPGATEDQRIRATVDEGNARYLKGEYAAAADAYTKAIEYYKSQPTSTATNERIASLYYNRAQAYKRLGRSDWRTDLGVACPALSNNPPPDCQFRQP